MRLGHVSDEGDPIITDTLLEGGIMYVYYLGTLLGCLGRRLRANQGNRGRCPLGHTRCGAPVFGYEAQLDICARLVNGIVPAWASELADYTSRGTFIAMEFTLNIFEVVAAYWLGYAVRFIDNGNSPFWWRFPIAFQIVRFVPLLFLLATCWLFPESPRWLARVGRNDEVLYILQRLRGTTGPDAGLAEAELADIKGVVELEKETDGTSYIAMLFGLRSGKLHTARRVQLVIWLQIMQCWTGIAGVTMYGPSRFHTGPLTITVPWALNSC